MHNHNIKDRSGTARYAEPQHQGRSRRNPDGGRCAQPQHQGPIWHRSFGRTTTSRTIRHRIPTEAAVHNHNIKDRSGTTRHAKPKHEGRSGTASGRRPLCTTTTSRTDLAPLVIWNHNIKNDPDLTTICNLNKLCKNREHVNKRRKLKGNFARKYKSPTSSI